MIISHDPKFVYMHIPRTGGTSTRAGLKKYLAIAKGFKHRTLSQIKDRMHLDWDLYFKWTRVRNPWDRLVSIYSRKSQRRRSPLKQDFESWVKHTALKSPRGQEFNQRRYVKDQGLDFVARFENIDKDFYFFCNSVGLPDIKLPKKNSAEHINYAKCYTPKIVDLLLTVDYFKKDLDFLGYDYKP